jgi:ABC-type transport system involved in cytochrome bd biosynthesis fused ATPase/permease subunit
MLPSSLEMLCITNEFTSLSDDTEFLRDFVDDLAQLPLLRLFRVTFGREDRFTKLSTEFSKHGVEFKIKLTF